MAFEAFIAWLPVAERESGKKLKNFQSDGGGEYTSQRFKQFLAEKGIKRLISLPYAHQQQGVAERMNRTLQNTMRKLLRGMQLPNHQWPEAMDHAVMLHNLLSSSLLPNNASPHLLWTGKQSSTKMLRWGLHLGIEKNYNAWKIFDVHSKETVAARDVIFYERLTLPTYLANLEENRDPTCGFRGDRHFASAADEADWDEQNVDNASDEAGPLPYCSVPIPMDDENPRESINTETYFDLADTGYVTPAEVNTNEVERVGPNFIPDPEDGDEAAYPEDTTLPRYTQSGLQILGLVTAVHGTDTPKEPATVQQALGGEHKEKWREAMDKELKAQQERNTRKVVPIGVARNKTVLTGKWVFRVKTKADGTIDKFKARWVVRGFDQEHGRDFTKTFAPVSRHTSLRILLAVAAMKKKKLRQIDVANAFLYAPVDAEIYVELPHGSHGEPNQVCQLQKSLYGIKQAPRLWQQYLHARLIRIGFKQLPHDQGMYRFTKDDDYILLIVYVDDLLYIGSTDNVTTWFEGELQKELTLTVSSTVTQYLALNIEEGEDAIYLNAAKYADTIAKRFALTPTTISTPYRYTAGNNKTESAPLKPAGIRNYQRKLGCLLFAAVTCRPDLSYSASQLATYLKRPEDKHMKELDRALHYLTEEGTATRPRVSSSETPVNQGTGFDPSMMEKFFSFMSFYEQHQQGAPAQSNNSNNNNNVTPMSLDVSSYARGNQQQQPTFAPYEPQRGSVSFMPQPASGQERTLDALQVQSQFAHVLKLQTTKPFDGKDLFTWSFEFELMMEGAQILGFFDGSLPYPTNGTQYEKQQYTYQSMMAYTILLRNITPTQQQNIRSYRGYDNSAELAYNHLKNLYQATDSVNQSRLMAQLTTIEMKPGEKGMA
ncbi:unnamed protein product [Closterium sp. NIES-53]